MTKEQEMIQEKEIIKEQEMKKTYDYSATPYIKDTRYGFAGIDCKILMNGKMRSDIICVDYDTIDAQRAVEIGYTGNECLTLDAAKKGYCTAVKIKHAVLASNEFKLPEHIDNMKMFYGSDHGTKAFKDINNLVLVSSKSKVDIDTLITEEECVYISKDSFKSDYAKSALVFKQSKGEFGDIIKVLKDTNVNVEKIKYFNDDTDVESQIEMEVLFNSDKYKYALFCEETGEYIFMGRNEGKIYVPILK